MDNYTTIRLQGFEALWFNFLKTRKRITFFLYLKSSVDYTKQ